jgi:alpha-galactosidase
MNCLGNKVEDLVIAYIGGGSRGWAWGLMSDLAGEEALSGTVQLYDINHEAAKSNEIIGNKVNELDGAKAKWNYQAVSSLEEALTGADFVIISILPGTFDEMYSDVHTPEKFGIYQAVGDTVGPGGYIRALRTIPMYEEIALAIKNFSPKAWVINYTNPMSVCVNALYKVFPEIKAFGCCHEVFNTQELLAKMLKDLEGIENVKRQDIKVNVLGINHFTWFDKASYKGMDLFPLYEKFVDKYYESGFIDENKDHWMNSSFSCAHRVKFDLFKRFGLIAAAGDRHLAEDVDGKWYLGSPENVKDWMFGLTTVDWRKADLEKRLARANRLVSGEEAFELKETGEDGVKQIKALVGLEDLVTNVNIPNTGQIPNLPLGTIVETNALFRKDALEPIMAGPIPHPIYGMVTRHVSNQETIVTAALTRDKKLAFSAFLNDPLVNLSYKDAEILFEEMLTNTKAYLPKDLL